MSDEITERFNHLYLPVIAGLAFKKQKPPKRIQTLAPVPQNEREIFMDALRGFAILGIFIANLGSGLSWYIPDTHMTGPFLHESLDHKTQFLHHMFIEGKFYSIFSLLFGWGIALQIKRGMAKGADALPAIK